MSEQCCVGDHVVLAPDYQQYQDALKGPLKPGDVGFITSSDIFNGIVRANVTVSGSSWHYNKRALRCAPDVDVELAAAPPFHATAAVGAPAAASPSADGFSFGAGPLLAQEVATVRYTLRHNIFFLIPPPYFCAFCLMIAMAILKRLIWSCRAVF